MSERGWLNPGLVAAFWDHMMVKYEFSVIPKNTSVFMRVSGWALKGMGIMDSEEFLSKYSTTIGRTVYVPFQIAPARATEKEMMESIVTCVHEAQHVIQFARNELEFVKNYVFSSAARAHYEADAYRTNMEMWFYMTGKMLSPKALAEKLRGYAVTEGDIHVTRKHLVSSAAVIKNGIVISGVSKDAIAWIKKNASRYR